MNSARTGLPAQLAGGPFTTKQASDNGIDLWRLRQMIGEGLVRRMLRGVYVHVALPDSTELRLDALALVRPTGLVAWRKTATWIHGVAIFEPLDEYVPPIEMCAPRDGNRTRHPNVRGARIDLQPDDVITMRGVEVTTPERTCLDVGALLKPQDALAVLDAYLRAGVQREDLIDRLPRFAGRRGVVQLRHLLAIADPRAESPPESWIRLIVSDSGLPAPDLQIVVDEGGYALFRLDLGWRRFKICVEYDGVEFHSSPSDRAKDRARREWLRAHGWIVIVVRKENLSADQIPVWIQEIQDALARRAHWA